MLSLKLAGRAYGLPPPGLVIRCCKAGLSVCPQVCCSEHAGRRTNQSADHRETNSQHTELEFNGSLYEPYTADGPEGLFFGLCAVQEGRVVLDVHVATGAYVLDALPDDEQLALESHCVRCSTCAQELVELRATAARLGLAATVTPPDTLKEQVLRITEKLPQPALWQRMLRGRATRLRDRVARELLRCFTR